MSDGLPTWTDVIFLAETFGVLPDVLVDQMSQLWYERAVAVLSARKPLKGKGKGPGQVDMSGASEIEGKFFLTG